MDLDSADILQTNEFISNPKLKSDINNDGITKFKQFYENEMKFKTKSKITESSDLKNIIIDELGDNFGDDLHKTIFENKNEKVLRSKREQITTISIDSRDRNRLLYHKPNNFKIFLGRTFVNVKKIELKKIEFPNTDAVINSNNNYIYWRNKEDIDLDFTLITNSKVNYPVYNNSLRIGSYDLTKLQTEITDKVDLVRRKQGSTNGNSFIGDYHFFVVDLDYETDIVTFTSLTLTQLSNNPISTTVNSNIITIHATAHSFKVNQSVYIVDPRITAGIDAEILTGWHVITVVTVDTFQFEVNVKASSTVGDINKGGGGGNIMKVGTSAPFQLLWGQYLNTFAQKIGYPLENSSEVIFTNINVPFVETFLMTIVTNVPHNLARDYSVIGQPLNIGTLVGPIFTTYSIYTIIDIPNTTNIVVLVNDNTVYEELLNSFTLTNYIKFGGYPVVSVNTYLRYFTQSFLINTATPHTYTFTDIDLTNINIYNTVDITIPNDPNYDGEYVISFLPSPTQIIVPGILTTTNIHLNNIFGQIPKKTPLTTHTVKVSQIDINFITISGKIHSKITFSTPHKLIVNDKFEFNNLESTPVMRLPVTVASVLDNVSILIQQEFLNVIINSNTFIGTGLITVGFPNHGFNSIISIVQYATGTALVTTQLNHNLISGNLIRISETDATSSSNSNSLNETFNIDSIVSPDSFVISRLVGNGIITINTPGTTGILGLNQDFFLYDVNDIGGILKSYINGNIEDNTFIKNPHVIREIIDTDSFTFMINNIYSTSTEIGGGNSVSISSLKHGFNEIQTNTKLSLLNRSINLEGENYCFLTCPQLDTMLNTGRVKNIFARFTLDVSPGFVCNNFLSNPKIFDTTPLSTLSELEFSVVNYDNTLYEFSDLDYSFAIEITEIIDTTDYFNHSSKRGIIDTY